MKHYKKSMLLNNSTICGKKWVELNDLSNDQYYFSKNIW